MSRCCFYKDHLLELEKNKDKSEWHSALIQTYPLLGNIKWLYKKLLCNVTVLKNQYYKNLSFKNILLKN